MLLFYVAIRQKKTTAKKRKRWKSFQIRGQLHSFQFRYGVEFRVLPGRLFHLYLAFILSVPWTETNTRVNINADVVRLCQTVSNSDFFLFFLACFSCPLCLYFNHPGTVNRCFFYIDVRQNVKMRLNDPLVQLLYVGGQRHNRVIVFGVIVKIWTQLISFSSKSFACFVHI